MSLTQESKEKFMSMTATKLKDLLKEKGLSMKGNKAQLIERLLAMESKIEAKDEVKAKAAPQDPVSKNPAPKNPAKKTGESKKVDSAQPATVTKATTEATEVTETTEATEATETTAAALSNGAEGHKEEPVSNDTHEDANTNEKKSIQGSLVGAKKTIRRIEMEDLPEDLREWEVDIQSDQKKEKGAKANNISEELGVTMTELMVQRQERAKKYGFQVMPEQTKRVLRQYRFLKPKGSEQKGNNSDPNEPKMEDLDTNGNAASSSNANGNKKKKASKNDGNYNDFSIESMIGENEISKGLTSEILLARRKRFGNEAVTEAFQQLELHKDTGNNRTGGNKGNQNYRIPLNTQPKQNRPNAGNTASSEDQNKIKARMIRFGKQLQKGDDERNTDKRSALKRSAARKKKPSDDDRSRSREKRQEKTVKLENEIKQETYQPSLKSGEAMKDFGSDDDFINSH